MDFQEIIEGNLGDTPPAVSDAAASVVSDSEILPEKVEETKTEEIPQAEEVKGEESEGELKDEPEPEETEITDEVVDKLLASNKLGKYAREAITYKSKQLSEAKTVLSEFEQLGTKEEIQTAIDFRNSFSGFTEKDGKIVSNIPEFAQGLMAKEPDKAIDLFNSLVGLRNPLNPSQTIFETLLNNPDVQARLKEQYQVSNEVAEIVPSDRREAYQRLTPGLKQTYEYASDAERKELLDQSQQFVDMERQKTEFQQTQRQKAEADFRASVETATETNFNTITTQFDESLKAIPFSGDEKQSSFLQFAVRDTVMTAATMAGTKAGDNALKALTDIGVQFPQDVPSLVTKLETYTRYAEDFKSKGDTPNYNRAMSEIGTIQQQLIGRSNKVAAQIAAYFGAKEREVKGKELLKPTTRPVIKGDGGGAETADYSDLTFDQIMAMP